MNHNYYFLTITMNSQSKKSAIALQDSALSIKSLNLGLF